MYREKLGMRGESSLLKKKMHLFSYSRFFTLSHKYFTCSRNAQWINSGPHENVADLKQYCLRQCLKFPRNTALLWSAVMGSTSKTFPPVLLVYNLDLITDLKNIILCIFGLNLWQSLLLFVSPLSTEFISKGSHCSLLHFMVAGMFPTSIA